MKKIFLAVCLSLVVLSSFVQAQEDNFPNLEFVYRDPKPVRHFDPETDPRFSDPELALKMRIIYKEENPAIKEPLRLNQRAQHFCIVGYEWQDGKRQVPVFWREFGEIIWWWGRDDNESADSEYGIYSFYPRSRSTDVERDTVSTVDGLRGSSYLIVRSGVIEVIRDCALYGRWHVIEPFEIPPVCDSGRGECEMPGVHPLSNRLSKQDRRHN
jgi:hypothetical protein